MKKRYLFVALTMFSLSLFAQLPNGAIAPDWTATDINGNVHRLYDYLNQDKVVILDFSATWCGPCWSYHNSGALKTFYNQYGPAGTDEAMVIFLEGDTRTNTACLYGPAGCNNSTVGNWVANTPYPIIDLPNATITGAYRIAFFPTVYGIYPDRRIFELKAVPAATLGNFVDNAPAPATEEHEVRIINYEGPVQACKGDLELAVRVQNYGLNTLSAIDFEIYDEEENLIKEFTWTGSMGKYDYRTISLGAVELTEPKTLTIKARTEGQEVFANSDLVVQVEPNPELVAYRNLRIEVTTDNNASETSWEMRDSKGTVLFTNDAGLENNRTYARTYISKEGECYRFTIFDSAGNGLQGNGGYRITDSNGDVMAEGKSFGFNASHGFSATRTVGVEEEITGLNAFQMYPNPVSDLLQVEMDLQLPMELAVSVLDESGQVLRQLAPAQYGQGKQTIQIRVDDMVPGTYFLMIQKDAQQSARPFVKVK